MAKPDVVVEVVFEDDDSTVDSREAGVDALLLAFFLPILLNWAKFLRVNRASFSWRPSLSPSQSICRFRNCMVGETCSCLSTLGSRREVSRPLRGPGSSSGLGCCLVIYAPSSVSRWLMRERFHNVPIPCPLLLLYRLQAVVRPFASVGPSSPATNRSRD